MKSIVNFFERKDWQIIERSQESLRAVKNDMDVQIERTERLYRIVTIDTSSKKEQMLVQRRGSQKEVIETIKDTYYSRYVS